MTRSPKYQEMARCEVCGRIFSAKSLTRGLCEACAAKPTPPPPVDFYALADDTGKIVDRVCRECGAHFRASPTARFCPECRVKRNADSSRRQAARKRAARLGTPVEVKPRSHICAMCGEPLDDPRRTFCEDCAHARQIQRLRQYRADNREAINARQRAKYAARKAAKTGGNNNGQ